MQLTDRELGGGGGSLGECRLAYVTPWVPSLGEDRPPACGSFRPLSLPGPGDAGQSQWGVDYLPTNPAGQRADAEETQGEVQDWPYSRG